MEKKKALEILKFNNYDIRYVDKSLKKTIDKAANKIEKSKIVGESLAEKIKNAKIEKIIFDRNGYKYHGRIKALAEAIRSSEITI